MSEGAPLNGPEHTKLVETHEELALPQGAPEKLLTSGETDPAKSVETVRSSVEQAIEMTAAPDPLKALEQADKASEEAAVPAAINRATRKSTLNNQLSSLRRKEKPAERVFSRFMHQPVIRNVSEVAGQTLSRPSGLLGGGLVAFLGTTGYVYLAKHLGFTYNYFVFILLFVGGFVIGLALEFLVWLATSRTRSHKD